MGNENDGFVMVKMMDLEPGSLVRTWNGQVFTAAYFDFYPGGEVAIKDGFGRERIRYHINQYIEVKHG